MSYRASHAEDGKGRAYQAAFSDRPVRAMLWAMERARLDEIVRSHFVGRRIQHLDFACGTGRILSHLSAYASDSVGVDVSASMLEVAREQCPSATLIEADLTQDDVLADRRFNLVTAFRFFPNAEPSLRREAAAAIAAHLADDGLFVFNNHKNLSSTRNRLARLAGRPGFTGMTDADVRALLDGAGLEVVAVHHLSVFPGSEARPLLPIGALTRLEGWLSQVPQVWRFGENLIYVCRRATP